MARSRLTVANPLSLCAVGFGLSVVGCSGPVDNTNGFGFGTDDSGAPGPSVGSGSGSNAEAGGSMQKGIGGSGNSSSGGATAGGSSSGGVIGSSSGSSSGGSTGGASSGGTGGSSGLGSSSGSSSSGGRAGNVDAGGADVRTTNDASPAMDATTTPDSAGMGTDAGLCANAADWLTPMNQARAAVNAGEPPLVCDPIAAQVALNYANKCNYAHNMNRDSDYSALGGTGGLGENIAAGSMLTVAGSVSLWVSEQQYYDHATNMCASGQMCGHYTQIVWKATTAVGCALVTCTMNSPFGSGSWQFAVCDFSPPGNYVGQPPY